MSTSDSLIAQMGSIVTYAAYLHGKPIEPIRVVSVNKTTKVMTFRDGGVSFEASGPILAEMRGMTPAFAWNAGAGFALDYHGVRDKYGRPEAVPTKENPYNKRGL